MANVNNSKIISAKTTQNGTMVYLTSCDAWSDNVAFAEVLTEGDFAWRLAFARRLREVVNASLTDAQENEHGVAELVAA